MIIEYRISPVEHDAQVGQSVLLTITPEYRINGFDGATIRVPFTSKGDLLEKVKWKVRQEAFPRLDETDVTFIERTEI